MSPENGERIRIRVYPERRSRYYTCIVFRAKRAMYRFYREEALGNSRLNFEAVCCPFRQVSYKGGGARGTKRPILGYVLFNERKLAGGVQSHEFTHAALDFLREERANLDLHDTHANFDTEERLAYLVGDMTRQFNDGLRRRGFAVAEEP
jgi:hypothetical protein